jgi:uncharacterized protein YndB with AHSA1/START domain
MMRFEKSVVINRPIEEVFAFTADYDTHLQWQAGVLQAESTSEGPLEVGSQYKYVIQMLGRRVDTTGEITVFEPPKRNGWKATSGPFPMEGVFTFDEVEGGTGVTLHVEVEAGGFFKLAEPLVIRMVRRQFETSLNNLKDLMEAQALDSA